MGLCIPQTSQAPSTKTDIETKFGITATLVIDEKIPTDTHALIIKVFHWTRCIYMCTAIIIVSRRVSGVRGGCRGAGPPNIR